MGLFNIFDKKYCAFCNDEIGLLGNRKLEDGNMCKKCAAKLSPWFSERRSSTVAEIGEQLAYREANKEKVAAFNATRTLGDYWKVILDEDAKRFVVTSQNSWRDNNPDVIDFADITGCRLIIEEDKDEITYDEGDKKNLSYNPKIYEYEYNFKIEITVNNPYFSEMEFRLNRSSVEGINDPIPPKQPEAPKPAAAPAPTQTQSVRPANTTRPTIQAGGRPTPQPATPARPAPQSYKPLEVPNHRGASTAAQTVVETVKEVVVQAVAPTPVVIDHTATAEYKQYKELGESIVEALTGIHKDVRQAAELANAPKVAVVCSHCGATTIPDANGCCEYCGSSVK